MMKMLHEINSGRFSPLSFLMGLSKYRMDKRGGPLARLPLDTFDRHMALWGTTGCGKSNVLEVILKRILPGVLQGEMSAIVIESSVLPDRIARYVDVVMNKADSRRVVWIDMQPGDNGSYDHIPPMNLFDIPRAYRGRMSADKMVGMYTNICRTLFDMELSGHMSNVLKAVVRLMVCVGNPSVKLLTDILYRPEAYIDDPDLDIPASLRAFFENRVFGDKASYKRQFGDVATRLEALTLSPLSSRLFCSDEPKLNLVDAVNDGALVVVALRAGEQSDDVATVTGRIFINLCKQISQSRRSGNGVRCITLVDEVHNFFVKKDSADIRGIHKESRKDRFGLCSGLQQPGDMGQDLFETFMNCSGIQMVGKMKTKASAKKIGDDMGLAADAIMALQTGQFYLKVSDVHEKPIVINVPAGSLGRWRGEKQRQAMQDQGRKSSGKMRMISARRYGDKVIDRRTVAQRRKVKKRVAA